MPQPQAQDILALEEQLTRASQAVDVDALDHLYAEDVMLTNVLGETACGKAALIDEAKRGVAMRQQAAAGGTPIATTYRKEDLTVVPLGDTAVASYRFVVELKGDGVDVHRRYRTTNVWAKRHGSWQIIAAHTAFVLDPKQAATLAG